uniref:Uncharacterized protein n=1 Tax=Caenorhabditis japonica TaxID=281687 RepID=A0A8R1IWL3_CAEJA
MLLLRADQQHRTEQSRARGQTTWPRAKSEQRTRGGLSTDDERPAAECLQLAKPPADGHLETTGRMGQAEGAHIQRESKRETHSSE